MLRVLMMVSLVGIACKKADNKAGNAEVRKLSGPCAAEREQAAITFDTLASAVDNMRDGILKQETWRAVQAQDLVISQVVNREECRWVMGVPDYQVEAKDRALWKRCNDDAASAQDVKRQLEQLMQDTRAVKAKATAVATQTRGLATRLREGPVPADDVKQRLEGIRRYYWAASEVRITVQDQDRGMGRMDPEYDLRPAEAVMQKLISACPAGAGAPVPGDAVTPTATPPPATPTATPAATPPPAKVVPEHPKPVAPAKPPAPELPNPPSDDL
jgi:hypothetical protein